MGLDHYLLLSGIWSGALGQPELLPRATLFREGNEMHQADTFVLVVLVLATVLALKFAPAAALALLGTLVSYRKVAK